MYICGVEFCIVLLCANVPDETRNNEIRKKERTNRVFGPFFKTLGFQGVSDVNGLSLASTPRCPPSLNLVRLRLDRSQSCPMPGARAGVWSGVPIPA